MKAVNPIGAVAIAAAALLAACTSASSTTGTGRTASAPPSARDSTPQSGTPVTVTSAVPPPPVHPRATATQALRAIVHGLPPGAVSVAVLDEASDAEYAFGARRGMWTASVYKLLVLEALLLERQDDGDWFSSGELDEITRMIEQSDNLAGYDLYLDAGGSAALTTAAHRLGMRHTVIGDSDPTFTTMSARDGLALLDRLVDRGPLQPRSQTFVLNLMRSVEADQRWGVGVLADPGSAIAIKNGWLNVDNSNGPGEDDDGLWVTNSVGIVRVDGQRLLLSVLTRHNPDLDTGIRLVQRVARIAATAVLPAD